MKGYRTLILAGVQLVFGILALNGFVTPEGLDMQVANAFETIMGAASILFGAATAGARVVTDTPVGKKDV